MRTSSHAFKCILSFFIVLFLFACANSDDDNNGGSWEKKVTVTLPSRKLLPHDPINVSASLKDTTFADATKFTKEMAQASFCLAMATDKEANLRKLFTECCCDKIQLQNSEAGKPYDDNKTSDVISYGLAHLRDKDGDVIVLGIRGLSYTYEWISNINLGKEGDHAGFTSAAKKVYDGLKDYIQKNCAESYKNKTLKLWISGYSRAGAVSDVLAYYILTGLEADSTYTKLDIAQKNVFVYTFNTPKSLCQAHAQAYTNVFNVISNADLVTYIAPEKYGVYRCGTDKFLFVGNPEQYQRKEVEKEKYSSYTEYTVSFTSEIDNWLKEYKIEGMPEFCVHICKKYTDPPKTEPGYPGDTYKTEKECIEYFVKLMTDTEKTGGFTLKSRESFVDTARPTFEYILKLYFDNSDKFAKAFEGLDASFFMKLISSADNFYTSLQDLFDKNGITYGSAEDLKNHCTKLFDATFNSNQEGGLSDFILKAFPLILGMVMPSTTTANKDLLRPILMHFPESACVALLKLTE